MKNNTSHTKDLLSQALKSTPDDFALDTVKHHIRVALQQIENVEDKRQKREVRAQERKQPFANLSPTVLRQTLDIIDEMIGQERKKIEEIHNRRKTNNNGEEEATLMG